MLKLEVCIQLNRWINVERVTLLNLSIHLCFKHYWIWPLTFIQIQIVQWTICFDTDCYVVPFQLRICVACIQLIDGAFTYVNKVLVTSINKICYEVEFKYTWFPTPCVKCVRRLMYEICLSQLQLLINICSKSTKQNKPTNHVSNWLLLRSHDNC